MARLNIEELVGGLLEAAMVAQGISERQHINSLRNYFNEDGTPKVKTFYIGERELVVPLYILADHSSIGLDELDIEFEARLIFGEDETNVSDLKRSLLGLFKKQGYEHNIILGGENYIRSCRPIIVVEQKFHKDTGIVDTGETVELLKLWGAKLLQRVRHDLIMGW